MQQFVILLLVVVVNMSWHVPLTIGNHDNTMQQMFVDRSEDDWRAVWHVERHRKCYQDLVSHMELVCRKDIYSLKKKSTGKVIEDVYLTPEVATSLFSSSNQRKKRGGIMDECCSDTGCSWEEYAEYCPTNRRLRTGNPSG